MCDEVYFTTAMPIRHDKRYQDVYGSLAEILNICANKIQVEA